jgi:hypothetical protein
VWLPSSQRTSHVVRCFDSFVAVTTAWCQVREKEACRARTASPTAGCEVRGKPGSGGRFSPREGGGMVLGGGGRRWPDRSDCVTAGWGPVGFGFVG